jgi:hypothetical protein
MDKNVYTFLVDTPIQWEIYILNFRTAVDKEGEMKFQGQLNDMKMCTERNISWQLSPGD